MLVAEPALAIDEIVRRPIMVVERAPDGVIVVERDRIADIEIAHGPPDIGGILLECELRRVDADHDESLVFISVRPGADIGQRA